MAEEGGVWRTVSGRRVFIRDGQSLTDAMKESGKFNKSGKSEGIKAEYGKKRRVFGKAEGTSYTVLPGNEYKLTGKRDGEQIEVPQNDSGEFQLYKAPRVSGFANGKYAADENENVILHNGQIVLNDHDFNNEAFYKVRAMVESETLRLAGMKKDGEFYRGTNNEKEIEYLKSGTMRASINHMTGESEKGVSVWESPKYPFKYTYRVSGEIVSVGSDGEPVLNPKTIKLIDIKSYDVSDYNEAMKKGKALFCETYGWSDKQYEAAKNGELKIKKWL